MIHSLAARIFLMMGHGMRFSDAAEWVLRRFPENLRGYWTRMLAVEMFAALS